MTRTQRFVLAVSEAYSGAKSLFLKCGAVCVKRFAHCHDGADSLFLENVLHYVPSELRAVMMANNLRLAEELSHVAQSVENDMRSGEAMW